MPRKDFVMGVDEILDEWMKLMSLYPKWQGLSNWKDTLSPVTKMLWEIGKIEMER